jgi:hypothetical protein
VGNDAAIKPKARVGGRTKAEIRPLFNMRSDRQAVATHGNGFGLISSTPR